jgi:hypothetical protein
MQKEGNVLAKAKRVIRRYVQKVKRKAAKKKIPLTILLPTAATFFTPPSQGWDNPYKDFTEGEYTNVFKDLVMGWTGYSVEEGKLKQFPTYLGMVGLGLVAHKIANMFGAGKIFSNMPGPLNKLTI